jgi:hypothetical protein
MQGARGQRSSWEEGTSCLFISQDSELLLRCQDSPLMSRPCTQVHFPEAKSHRGTPVSDNSTLPRGVAARIGLNQASTWGIGRVHVCSASSPPAHFCTSVAQVLLVLLVCTSVAHVCRALRRYRNVRDC